MDMNAPSKVGSKINQVWECSEVTFPNEYLKNNDFERGDKVIVWNTLAEPHGAIIPQDDLENR